jgi:hypothetical protein
MYEGESGHTSCTSVRVQVLTFWCTMVAWVRSVTLSLCRAAGPEGGIDEITSMAGNRSARAASTCNRPSLPVRR